MIITTEGIVLKTIDYRETSCISRFFTRDHGKIAGILKGIRKDRKKFGSTVDRFSVNDIVYYEYRHSDLHLISQCDLKEYFFPVRQDYQKSVAANYALELVDLVMPGEEKNLKVYELMLDFLASLGAAADIDKLVHIFQIKILQLSGFSPHLDACVRCGKLIKGKSRFSMTAGGLVCADCPAIDQTFTLISQGTVATILYVERAPWRTALKIGLTGLTQKELKYILNNFLTYHLEKNIRSAKYM